MNSQEQLFKYLDKLNFTLPTQRVAFEGGDGAGKSTFINQLKKVTKNFNLVTVAEPAAVDEQYTVCSDIRKLIMENPNLDNRQLAALFAVARKQLNHDKVLTMLAHHNTVLSDRSVLSSLVYQETSDFNQDDIIALNKAIDPDFALPDKVIYLDIDPVYAEERLRQNQDNCAKREQNYLDEMSLNKKEKIREAFLRLVTKYPKHLIIRATDVEKDVDSELLKVMKFLVD